MNFIGYENDGTHHFFNISFHKLTKEEVVTQKRTEITMLYCAKSSESKSIPDNKLWLYVSGR